MENDENIEMDQWNLAGHEMANPPTEENSAGNQDGQNDQTEDEPPLAVYERDEDSSEEDNDESCCKIWSSRVTKIILALVLFLAITLGIFSTKLSLLVLVYPLRATANQTTTGYATCNLVRCSSDDTFCRMTENGTAVDPEDTDCVRIATITTLSMVMMIPYAGVFLWSFWKGACNSRVPWPTKPAAATGIAMSIFEVFGVGFFILVVLPSATSSQIANVMAMNAVHLFPLLVQFGQQLTNRCCPSKHEIIHKRNGWLIVAFAVGLVACTVGLIGYSLHSSATFLVTLLPLTLAWTPDIKLFKKMTLKKSQRSQAGRDEVQPFEEIACDDNDFKTSARWKMGIISNLVKFLLTFPIIYAIVYFDGTVEDPSLMWQWAAQPLWRIDRNWSYFLAFLTNICCATGVLLLVVVALKSKLQLAFILSIVVSSLCFVLAVHVPPFCEFLSLTIPGLNLCETAGDAQVGTWVAMIAMLLTELVMVVTISLSPVEVMEPEAKLFWVPGYNAVFLNQHLLLNKKTEFNSPEDHRDKDTTVKNTHVYICTTMYRESKEEMTQLMKSIRNMATSPCKEDRRKYESHILFDDGCRQLELQPFAIQLLSIIHEMTEVTGADGRPHSLLDDCIKWQTPYGLQLQFDWRADGDSNRGMKFYIHLKDNLLVKNKKRWSQIMYMTYILNYMAYYKPLGMESGAIADGKIIDSSQSTCHENNCLRLHAKQPWEGTTDTEQTLNITLNKESRVTGIILQAGAMGERVKKIKVGNELLTQYLMAFVASNKPLGMKSGAIKDKQIKVTPKCSHENSLRLDAEKPWNGNTAAEQKISIDLKEKSSVTGIILQAGDMGRRVTKIKVANQVGDDLDRDTYILATDADVKFTPKSANKLLDLAQWNPDVGAVCGRTHCLGSGPMYWLQLFDYAVGHWFQKVCIPSLS
uniref:Chitin synthase n=1 Tax=Branchiostoma floridae TaxID=7739 RepID=C3Y4T2_BRAFL|eukprot:XP_002608729.1 hypothetical protein BRAFLDRAFT_73950 [Branchiostoma floridae]